MQRPVLSAWNVLLTAHLIFSPSPDLSLNITCPDSLPNHLSTVDTLCDSLWLGHGPQIWIHAILDVLVRVLFCFFLMRFTFKSVGFE